MRIYLCFKIKIRHLKKVFYIIKTKNPVPGIFCLDIRHNVFFRKTVRAVYGVKLLPAGNFP